MNRALSERGARDELAARGGLIGRAFTIIELLIVIVILAIVTLIALPSFTSMLYSQEANLAESLIRTGMKASRDAALRSASDDDAAAVFVFQAGGRISIVPCVRVGVLPPISAADEPYEIFVPSSELEPVQLPRNWMIRGYASPSLAGDAPSAGGWYESDAGADRVVAGEGNWVFPETDFYDQRSASSGEERQTFMVRFRARTGEIVTSPSNPALVVLPRPTYLDRGSLPGNACNADRLDIAADLAQSVRCILSSPEFDAAQRAELIGVGSSDAVMVRPVSQLALYDENKLAAGLGSEVDRVSRCLYRNVDGTTVTGPRLVNGVTAENINEWINGDTNLNGQVESSDQGDAPLAKLFMLDRYTGVPRLMEVQP